MKKASIQLTYIEAETEKVKRLSPRKLLETDAFPFEMEVPGHGTLFTICFDGKKHSLKTAEGLPVTLNGTPASTGMLLTSGDRLEADGVLLNFHIKHESRSLSTASRMLSQSTRWAVGFFIVLEVAIMLGLSALLASAHIFEASVDRQQLSYDIIQLQKKLDKSKAEDALETAMLSMLKIDVEKRIAYIGEHGTRMSPRQRKNMAHDMKRINALADAISKEGSVLPPNNVDIDAAVRRIIQPQGRNL